MVSNPAPESPPAGALPRAFLAALALAAGFVAFVAWDQSHWWRVKEDYSFGWLVPVFTLFVVHDRWDRIRARLAEAARSAPGPRWARWTLNLLAGIALVLGALFFLLGAFYRAGAGTSQPGTFALTSGMVAIVFGLLFFNVETGRGGSRAGGAGGWRALAFDPRLRVATLFLFPVLVWMISAPLVSAVESQLSLFLLRKVVVVVSVLFELVGLPLEQQGNVLMLPKGPVGVADACSGIRSLTACLFAGSFLAATFLTETWKQVLLVAAAMAFAFATNLLRSLFLTAWAYAHGPDAISGALHDFAGYAVLGLTCLALLLLVPLLNLRIERAAD